jgi:hypothetical protein
LVDSVVYVRGHSGSLLMSVGLSASAVGSSVGAMVSLGNYPFDSPNRDDSKG